MLRFDKTSIGEDWVPEYGSPSDEDDFDALQEYSPLHHVKITTTPVIIFLKIFFLSK